MSEWDDEIAGLRKRISGLDDRFEEVLAAGPIAPGIVEALTELGHDTASAVERLLGRASKASDASDASCAGSTPVAPKPDGD